MKKQSVLLAILTALVATSTHAKPLGDATDLDQQQRPYRSGPLKKFDSNQDGAITRAEAEAVAMQRVDRLFKQLDRNDDQVIAREESLAARKRFSEKRGSLRQELPVAP